MDKFFISVVIPAFNEEKYLPASLESLQTQNYPKDKYEIIVVDHDSTDQTGNIARESGAKVIFFKEPNIAAVRQAGFDVASGEIFAGTDADTTHPTDWLEKINVVFQSRADVVGVTGGASFASKSRFNRLLARFFPLMMYTQFVTGKPALNGFNFAVRASAFREIGGFNKDLVSAEDVDLGMRLAKVGKVVFEPKLLATTSGRRMDASRGKFFSHHIRNLVKFTLLGKRPEGFDNIR